MLRDIESRVYSLHVVVEEFKHDKEIVLAAVRVGGHNLRAASADLRRDVEVCRAAVLETPP